MKQISKPLDTSWWRI